MLNRDRNTGVWRVQQVLEIVEFVFFSAAIFMLDYTKRKFFKMLVWV